MELAGSVGLSQVASASDGPSGLSLASGGDGGGERSGNRGVEADLEHAGPGIPVLEGGVKLVGLLQGDRDRESGLDDLGVGDRFQQGKKGVQLGHRRPRGWGAIE